MNKALGLLPALFAIVCSADPLVVRDPAAVPTACNRQVLGEAGPNNRNLVDYNAKRITAVSDLLGKQIEGLKKRATTTKELQGRIDNLQKIFNKITSAEIKPWDEPNKVSWELGLALDAYVADRNLDDHAHLLSDKEKEDLKYVVDNIIPNLSRVNFWAPDFCRKAINTAPAPMFN